MSTDNREDDRYIPLTPESTEHVYSSFEWQNKGNFIDFIYEYYIFTNNKFLGSLQQK